MVCMEMLIGQQAEEHSLAQTNLVLLEGHLGRAVLDNQGSKAIGGFGCWGYWNIKNFQNRKSSSIGMSFPLRLAITSPNEGILTNYDHSLSGATLFRLTIQHHPIKETLWFFAGAGPEIRIIWKDKKSSRGLPLFQQEFGIKICKPNSSLLKNVELGLSSGIPVRKKEWDDRLFFGSFFVRFDAY